MNAKPESHVGQHARPMKRLGKLVFFLSAIAAAQVWALITGRSASAADINCNVPELIHYQRIKYNELVCEGVAVQHSGDIARAIETFERALAERLFEEPNVYLYSRLAYLYAVGEKFEDARRFLAQAKLSLEVFLGIASCEMDYEYSPGLRLEELYDAGQLGISKAGRMLRQPYVRDLYFEMCQVNIAHYYAKYPDLDSVVGDPLGALVLAYRRALEEIESRSGKVSGPRDVQ